MTEFDAVLAAFHQATECEAAVWTQSAAGAPVLLAHTSGAVGPPCADDLPTTGSPRMVRCNDRDLLVSTIPGPRKAWLAVGPCTAPDRPLDRFLAFLLPVTTQYLQSALEVEHAANELAERYEEINLLYTISEILGRTVTLEEAARTILTEISETVGARRGAILVHDRITDTLNPVAALGFDAIDAPPIAVDDEQALSARVFRTQHALISDGSEAPYEPESAYRRGATLSVPIMWTTPEGGEPLGVVHLSDRRSGHPFSAGDQKLVLAIATQIGTAVQNTRLVRASLSQQRLVHEMELAHDLQMKLLPAVNVVAPEADVAARVVPAESVGGDFYHLFRLGATRTGIMIGDVSSHGYRAALIMALAMSATAIHAQTTADPGETLAATLASLRDELTSTEMFISALYAVIDRRKREIRFANMGHPHAFMVHDDGSVERLNAIDPPLGMVDGAPGAESRPWKPGKDLLLLFTDGLSDARNRYDERLGEQPVLDVVTSQRAEPTGAILDAVFERLDEHTGGVAKRDDVTLVIVRS